MSRVLREQVSEGADAGRLEACARLLAALLLHEVEPPLVRELEAHGARAELLAMGLELPAPQDRDALEALAAEYFEVVVRPGDALPLVQSLAAGDAFEGEPASAMRAIAEAAGVGFDASAARGAPIDHLGSQLGLWAHIHGRDREAARQFVARHLRWALPSLKRRREESFYGRLCAVIGDFIACLPYRVD